MLIFNLFLESEGVFGYCSFVDLSEINSNSEEYVTSVCKEKEKESRC